MSPTPVPPRPTSCASPSTGAAADRGRRWHRGSDHGDDRRQRRRLCAAAVRRDPAGAAAQAADGGHRTARPAGSGGARAGPRRRRRIAARGGGGAASPLARGANPVRGLPDSATAPGIPAPPLPDHITGLGRYVADRLVQITAQAAQDTGCEVVGAAAASRDHHAWSADPWTVGAGSLLPWRPKPFHPNARGMAAVADLIVARVGQP